MGGEVLALEVHSIKAHMDENVSAILPVDTDSMLGLEENRDLAINRRINLALGLGYSSTLAHSPAGKSLILDF